MNTWILWTLGVMLATNLARFGLLVTRDYPREISKGADAMDFLTSTAWLIWGVIVLINK
jgi:hypothetical protein